MSPRGTSRYDRMKIKPLKNQYFSCLSQISLVGQQWNNPCTLTVLASHRESVLSAEHVSSVFEYGRNTMLFTESAWPRSVFRQRSLQVNHKFNYLGVLTLSHMHKTGKCNAIGTSHLTTTINITTEIEHWILCCGAVSYAVQGSSNSWVCGWNPKVWPFNEICWAVLSCGIVYYAVQGGSNSWVCGWNPKVWPVKWNLLSSTFLWCCLLCYTMWVWSTFERFPHVLFYYYAVQGGSIF